MKHLVIASSFVLAIGVAVIPAKAETSYTINGWPQGLMTIPCDAFENIGPHTWHQTGTIIVEPGHNTMSGNTFSNSGETRLLNSRCGSK